MTRIFAVSRRIFLAGLASLIVLLFIANRDMNELIQAAKELTSLRNGFSLYFVVSPIVYLIMVIVSVIYIRKNGQFAAFQQTQAWITSFIRCIGSDLLSPFKLQVNFLTTRGKKTASGSKSVFTRRFLLSWVLILLCAIGVYLHW